MIALKLLLLSASGVVLVRCLCQVSRLSHKKWAGHRMKFAGLSLAYALTCGGAAGMVLGWAPAPMLLLTGVAGRVLFDRRIQG